MAHTENIKGQTHIIDVIAPSINNNGIKLPFVKKQLWNVHFMRIIRVTSRTLW